MISWLQTLIILDLERNGPSKTADVARRTGLKPPVVRNAARWARTNGHIRSIAIRNRATTWLPLQQEGMDD